MTCLLIHSVCSRRLNQPVARDLNIWKITWEKLLIPSAWPPTARPPVPLTPGLPLASAASIRLFGRLFENLHAQWAGVRLT